MKSIQDGIEELIERVRKQMDTLTDKDTLSDTQQEKLDWYEELLSSLEDAYSIAGDPPE